MKKTFLVSVVSALAVLAIADGALAADLAIPTKAPPPPPAVYSWTGFYSGLNVGLGTGSDPFSMTTVSGAGYPEGLPVGTPLYTSYAPTNAISLFGFNGGGQIGYNYQFDPSWAAGVEADIQGSSMTGSVSCLLACGTPLVIVNSPLPTSTARVVFSDISAKDDLNWFGTVRGRFGYTPSGGMFAYVTGGLAYGDVQRSGAVAGRSTNIGNTANYNTFAGSYDNSATQVGWTIGGGLEWKVFSNWSVKAEYLYVDLGSATDTFNTIYLPGSTFGTPGTVAGVRTDTSSFRENIFRVGFNYKFGP